MHSNHLPFCHNLSHVIWGAHHEGGSHYTRGVHGQLGPAHTVNWKMLTFFGIWISQSEFSIKSEGAQTQPKKHSSGELKTMRCRLKKMVRLCLFFVFVKSANKLIFRRFFLTKKIKNKSWIRRFGNWISHDFCRRWLVLPLSLYVHFFCCWCTPFSGYKFAIYQTFLDTH